MLGDLLEGVFRFVRESGAPRLAATWALIAFVIAAVLIRRQRDDLGWKLGASLLAFGGAAGWLLWWSLQPGAVYYKFVDEVAASTLSLRLRRAPVTVHGRVVRDSLEQRRGTGDYRFHLGSRWDRPPAIMQVRYSGVLPDLFRSDAEIVAKGWLAADGSLDVVPDGIMARCPSKYVGPRWPRDCLP